MTATIVNTSMATPWMGEAAHPAPLPYPGGSRDEEVKAIPQIDRGHSFALGATPFKVTHLGWQSAHAAAEDRSWRATPWPETAGFAVKRRRRTRFQRKGASETGQGWSERSEKVR